MIEVWAYLAGIALLLVVSSPIWAFNYEKIWAIERKDYILRVLALFAVAFVLGFLEGAEDPGLALAAGLALIPLPFVIIYFTVQRTKDAGVSKHWTWTVFLPLASIVSIIVFMVLPTKAKTEAQAETGG